MRYIFSGKYPLLCGSLVYNFLRDNSTPLFLVGGDQTDGGVGGSVDLEYGYEDDFEDYVESDSDEADGSEEAEMVSSFLLLL